MIVFVLAGSTSISLCQTLTIRSLPEMTMNRHYSGFISSDTSLVDQNTIPRRFK